MSNEDPQGRPAADASREDQREYEAPKLLRLGTLAELTHGGVPVGPNDGFGSAGAAGSF